MTRRLVFLSISLLCLFGVAAAACFEDDTDRIERANEAAGGTDQPGDLGRATVFDLRGGDCFNEISDREVDIVSCASPHEFEVLELVQMQGGDYPGDSASEGIGARECPRLTHFFLHPTRESWGAGDRVLLCLQRS